MLHALYTRIVDALSLEEPLSNTAIGCWILRQRLTANIYI